MNNIHPDANLGYGITSADLSPRLPAPERVAPPTHFDDATEGQAAGRRNPNWRHGGISTRTYVIWRGMKSRCLNPNVEAYAIYGGRGITVCERWVEKFQNFLADMGHAPDGMSLDRINNNGNYEPGNCRWATRTEQNRNSSHNHLVTAFGETKCVSEWRNDPRFKASRGSFQWRLKRGWDPELAMTTPSMAATAKRWGRLK